jgi:signal transduction histidine kinase
MSILVRLVVLVLLALVPAIAAHAINEFLLNRDRQQEVRLTASIDAQVRNTELDSVVGGIQHLLGAVVRLPAVASLDGSSCGEQLAIVTKEYGKEFVLIAADSDGAAVCSNVPHRLGTTVADSGIFREVIGSGQFKAGQYDLNPITSAKALSFGYPIGGGAGGPSGAVIAYLSLDWLGSDLRRVPFLPGRTLTITDRNGVVLAQAPKRDFGVGQKLPTSLLGMINAAAPGAVEMTVQGRPMLYGYVPITVPPANIYVLYAIEQNIAFAPIYHARWRGIALSLLSVLGALVIAWLVGVRFIRRPVRRLLDAAQSWQRGDFSVRANLGGRSSEIVDLGAAFDSMAAKLELHEQQLESANRIKDIVLAAAGHDLRQPLQIISMTVSVLARRPLTDRESRYVERADKAIDQLVGALDELIEVSRVRYGMAQPQRQPVMFGRLLQEIGEQWSTKAVEKGLRFRVRRCDTTVESDPRMLSTILHNLIGNAIKYTDRGGILIGCRRRGAELWIEVYDSGIGIPEDRIETIFGELHQLDPKREGLGLGLWIARSTAEVLGHELSVRSTVGRGSRFRIVVPLGTARARDQVVPSSARMTAR